MTGRFLRLASRNSTRCCLVLLARSREGFCPSSFYPGDPGVGLLAFGLECRPSLSLTLCRGRSILARFLQGTLRSIRARLGRFESSMLRGRRATALR